MPSSLEKLRNSDCFEKIVERVSIALLVANDAHEIVVANRRAEALFGYTVRELLGQTIEQLVASGAIEGAPVPVSQNVSSEFRDAVALRKDGVKIPIEMAVSSMATSVGLFTLVCCADITARNRAEEVEQQMAAIIESADDAILTKSLDGTVRSWNPAAERLLGYRAEEIVGGPVTRLIPSELQDEEAMILNQIRMGQRVDHFETIRRKRDGSRLDVSLTISPIRDRTGTIIGASKIMRDISNRKRSEANLLRSNAELERINAELDEFVYTASHDLRSPLTNVAKMAQWILEDDRSLSDQTRDRLMLIKNRIERLKRLLNDIRNYARMGRYDESSGAQLSAAALTTEVVEDLHIPQGFAIRPHSDLEKVQVKRTPLAQILRNLIDNAIKHHHRQSGTVAVSVDSSRPMMRFSVIDDGLGIPKEYQEEIFEMFKTLKSKDQVEGSGMGLALVKKIVAGMGGVCGVKPVSGGGSEFWFDWPKLPYDTDAQ
jgi:PAS domain S-box-containing protein